MVGLFAFGDKLGWLCLTLREGASAAPPPRTKKDSSHRQEQINICDFSKRRSTTQTSNGRRRAASGALGFAVAGRAPKPAGLMTEMATRADRAARPWWRRIGGSAKAIRSRRCSARKSRRRHSSSPGTVVHADEAGAWNDLHGRFEMKRINHLEAYSLDGACTNWAEEFFSRMRRAEIGHHHHIAGPYLLRFAQEASGREDNRRISNGEQVSRVAAGDGGETVGRFQRLLATAYSSIMNFCLRRYASRFAWTFAACSTV